MSYVDLHCHLLPGIDDGAATPADALAYALRLEADGVRDVACTPHIKRAEFPRVRIGELAGLRARTQAMLDDVGLAVRLHGGGELAHEDAAVLGPEDLDAIAQGPPHARWLLLECPFAGIDAAFLDAIPRLRARRLRPPAGAPRALRRPAPRRPGRAPRPARRRRGAAGQRLLAASATTGWRRRPRRWRCSAAGSSSRSPPMGTPARAGTRSSSASTSCCARAPRPSGRCG